jgi:uncharacterized repeat protein (TIGR01451 family)
MMMPNGLKIRTCLVVSGLSCLFLLLSCAGQAPLAPGAADVGVSELLATLDKEPADLAVASLATMAGQTAVYTLTVTNRGPALSRDVTLSDSLPPGATLAWFTPGRAPVTWTARRSTRSVLSRAEGLTARQRARFFATRATCRAEIT